MTTESSFNAAKVDGNYATYCRNRKDNAHITKHYKKKKSSMGDEGSTHQNYENICSSPASNTDTPWKDDAKIYIEFVIPKVKDKTIGVEEKFSEKISATATFSYLIKLITLISFGNHDRITTYYIFR